MKRLEIIGVTGLPEFKEGDDIVEEILKCLSTQSIELTNKSVLVIAQKIVKRFGEDLTGCTFGIWGLAFKPGTDDMREAPAIYVIKELVKRGAMIKTYDPKAIDEAKEHYLKEVQNITYR